MGILFTDSLSRTVDAINEAYFFNKPPAKSERLAAARWIASRQGQPGAYAGMYAPLPGEPTNGLRLFTGETILSDGGSRHVMGEEANRALHLLVVTDASIKEAIKRAAANFLERLNQWENEGHGRGFFCCGPCSAAFWRNITAGGLDRKEERLDAGLKYLKAMRKGEGKWRRFPFHYTLLALNEMELQPAIEEMRYAAPVLERSLKCKATADKYAQRRRVLTERILAKC